MVWSYSSFCHFSCIIYQQALNKVNLLILLQSFKIKCLKIRIINPRNWVLDFSHMSSVERIILLSLFFNDRKESFSTHFLNYPSTVMRQGQVWKKRENHLLDCSILERNLGSHLQDIQHQGAARGPSMCSLNRILSVTWPTERTATLKNNSPSQRRLSSTL